MKCKSVHFSGYPAPLDLGIQAARPWSAWTPGQTSGHPCMETRSDQCRTDRVALPNLHVERKP
eukprot:12162525-Alexandrium_andersonii.AAC.1